MEKALSEVGIDFRFIGFAFGVTVFSVLVFSFGLPLLIFVQALFTGENTSILRNNLRPGATILLIPSTIFAVKALPYTIPAGLIGWAVTHRMATTLRCSTYLAAIISALGAAMFSSFAFGYWFDFTMKTTSSIAIKSSLLVLPSTLIASLLVSAIIYRPEKVTF